MASLIIVVGCTYIGIHFGDKLQIRAKQLAAFQSALEILKFNIVFLNLPLAEALYKVAKSQSTTDKPSGVVSRIFKNMSVEISRSQGKTVQNAWEMSITKERRELKLMEEDILALNEFAARLGNGDRDDQTGNIDITSVKLNALEAEAREIFKKNAKLYKGLGLLGGLLIVVLLL